MKTLQFDPSMKIFDACSYIRQKIQDANRGNSECLFSLALFAFASHPKNLYDNRISLISHHNTVGCWFLSNQMPFHLRFIVSMAPATHDALYPRTVPTPSYVILYLSVHPRYMSLRLETLSYSDKALGLRNTLFLRYTLMELGLEGRQSCCITYSESGRDC